MDKMDTVFFLKVSDPPSCFGPVLLTTILIAFVLLVWILSCRCTRCMLLFPLFPKDSFERENIFITTLFFVKVVTMVIYKYSQELMNRHGEKERWTSVPILCRITLQNAPYMDYKLLVLNELWGYYCDQYGFRLLWWWPPAAFLTK